MADDTARPTAAAIAQRVRVARADGVATKAARDVPAGRSWVFREHRNMAQVIADEARDAVEAGIAVVGIVILVQAVGAAVQAYVGALSHDDRQALLDCASEIAARALR
jgi:hypothetical protein